MFSFSAIAYRRFTESHLRFATEMNASLLLG